MNQGFRISLLLARKRNISLACALAKSKYGTFRFTYDSWNQSKALVTNFVAIVFTIASVRNHSRTRLALVMIKLNKTIISLARKRVKSYACYSKYYSKKQIQYH